MESSQHDSDLKLLEGALEAGNRRLLKKGTRHLIAFIEYIGIALSLYSIGIVYSEIMKEVFSLPVTLVFLLIMLPSLLRIFITLTRKEGNFISYKEQDNYVSGLDDETIRAYQRAIDLYNENNKFPLDRSCNSFMKISDLLIAINSIKSYR